MDELRKIALELVDKWLAVEISFIWERSTTIAKDVEEAEQEAQTLRDKINGIY